MSGIWEAMRASETQRLAAVERLRERVKELIGETAFMTADEEKARLVDIVDGLRERLKAAEAVATYESDTEFGPSCPFWIAVGGCSARQEISDWCECVKRIHDSPPAQPRSGLPCRLDEGPILVKKAEAEQTGGSEGNRGREATTAPCPKGGES